MRQGAGGAALHAYAVRVVLDAAGSGNLLLVRRERADARAAHTWLGARMQAEMEKYWRCA